MSTNIIQAMVDGMNHEWQRHRALTQMTLGSLIKRLKELPEGCGVSAFGNAHSYRGYYIDLAFERIDGVITATEALRKCEGCMGKVFEGYKGGEYLMGESTPVWFSSYGHGSGKRILFLNDDGTFVAEEEP